MFRPRFEPVTLAISWTVLRRVFVCLYETWCPIVLFTCIRKWRKECDDNYMIWNTKNVPKAAYLEWWNEQVWFWLNMSHSRKISGEEITLWNWRRRDHDMNMRSLFCRNKMRICAWEGTNIQANMCKGLYSNTVQNKEFCWQLDIIYFSRKLIYHKAFFFRM